MFIKHKYLIYLIINFYNIYFKEFYYKNYYFYCIFNINFFFQKVNKKNQKSLQIVLNHKK